MTTLLLLLACTAAQDTADSAVGTDSDGVDSGSPDVAPTLNWVGDAPRVQVGETVVLSLELTDDDTASVSLSATLDQTVMGWSRSATTTAA